jgi:hypothetical protein
VVIVAADAVDAAAVVIATVVTAATVATAATVGECIAGLVFGQACKDRTGNGELVTAVDRS